MKNHFGLVKMLAALGLLLFAACANPLVSPPGQNNAPAKGKGLVRVGTGTGAARTAIPDSVFDHYQCLFSKDGGTPTPMAPFGNGPDMVFELDPGNWSVAVKAFVGAADATLAAQGSENFTVKPDRETQVTVRLSPVIGEGTGTLNYTLAYPAGAGPKAFTLTLIADDTAVDLLDGAGLPLANPFTGSRSLATGYYLVRARVEKNGIPVEKIEVAHIYKDMITALELEFVDDDFTAVVVTSAADSGPGTLREALTAASAAILIDLPAGDRVIALNSPLSAITRSIVIEGNGATLTRNDFAGTTTSQLLYISSADAELRVSRLHFKGGRADNNGAAIQNEGKLVLESCVFSDNTLGAGANKRGGAIHSSGSLTVSGCTFYGNSAGTAAGSQGGAIYQAGGTLSLTGNIFWGNAAYQYAVVRVASGTVASGGFNVSDQADGARATASGWIFDAADKTAASLPFSFVNFKPIGGAGAVGVITAKPAGYPTEDFYGVAIPETGAAAGAAQTATQPGYILDYASQGPGAINVVSGTVDADGIAGGSVTLKAVPDSGKTFIHWLVDGAVSPETTDQLALTIAGHTRARAVFAGSLTVTNNGDSGAGSLRAILGSAIEWDTILLPAGQTITLNAPLPRISKSIIIKGNGATLTQSRFTPADDSQLLCVDSADAEVRISRLHFKGGRATFQGAAIQNAGKLVLESCAFSDNLALGNRTSYGYGTYAYGAAIYTAGSGLTVSGCVFYGNRAEADRSQGGAIYQAGGTLSLTGNVFWGNTAVSYPVVRSESGTVTSGGFNVSDQAGGSADTQSGWVFASTDITAVSLPISPAGFKPIAGGPAADIIAAKPAGYPEEDFYGVSIPGTNASAGTAQTAVAGSGFILDYKPEGPGMIEVVSGTVDAEGFVTGGNVTLRAIPDDGKAFVRWLVDDAVSPETSDQLALNINGYTKARAVFAMVHLVTNNGDSGPGSLREALGAAIDDERIAFPAGQTITLSAPLPQITKSIVIEGNGATLTQSGFTPTETSQLLSIVYGAEVRISRLLFTGGIATDFGAAILNRGKLTLESCIFADNMVPNYRGGAIFTTNDALTVLGCTFIGNTAGHGGAIYQGLGTLSLTGNIFARNIASYEVGNNAGHVTTGGYNVADKAYTSSGWIFADTDIRLSVMDLSFDTALRPFSVTGSLPVIAPLPAGFPTSYFDGTSRGTSSAPGAMPIRTSP
jgi:predicted outer membrane repeat protein